MSYPGSWKEGDGDYLLVVSGVMRYAPYLAGWQEFKDHLRKVVKEQPGWADVYSSQGHRRGEMQGWCRLKDREDADAVFKVYHRARGMLVHVWETSRRGDGYRLMRCNCSTVFPEVPEGGHSNGRCGIDIARVNQLGGGRAAPVETSAPYMSAQSGYMYSTYPQMQAYPQQQPGYAHVPTYPAYPLSNPPVYSTTTNGIPVNIQRGAILTEARGIFIRNLSFKCTMDDLNALLLQTVGYAIDIQFIRDNRTGAFKGAATAKFASKELAQNAANTLNGTLHMGMTLHVRMDTDATVVGQTEPMVVNGSYRVSPFTQHSETID
ncbi:hypothetical protein COCCADRAFT_3734 [Bipolaris zeicola 26-R-13]|uniref:RRM domain-containing protein n=1 Tax=Cochliobolus carbonum (strain 26-R-13) TaxID=930089 RepID=W6YAJ6_COCC2|nr:uncharacterized protein COCCADRAFT_3734 [Bipolaris zeicola 26-R-13]EUC34993.1 hypothetical protein COCCADRAFT_3734 [Bipolaris zeicola 26-R-13]